MSREGNDPGRDRRRSAAVEAAVARPSARLLSRRQRELLQQRLLIASVGAIAMLAVLVVGVGAFHELIAYPNEPVALVGGESLTLRRFTEDLTDEMRSLQSQVASGTRNEQNPNAASSQVQRLISAQETLPEDVLEKDIERVVIRQEAGRRGIIIPPQDIDTKVNENLSIQRALINAPTSTPTSTLTPRPTTTPTPEGFEPSPTATPTPTLDPLTPLPTADPLTPTLTRTPFPTRETSTPVASPTRPATMEPDEFRKAYDDLRPLLKSEDTYRRSIEFELIRERLRLSLGADLPTGGARVHVLRLATSTRDEACVALIQVAQPGEQLCVFQQEPENQPSGLGFPFEELLAQARDPQGGERIVDGRESGDLGWVALGAETRRFDAVVFAPETPLNVWLQPFEAGNHWELVRILEREDFGEYNEKNMNKMRDRVFKEWLDVAKASSDVVRDLSAQERQWAVDRASKGIIQTTTDRRRR